MTDILEQVYEALELNKLDESQQEDIKSKVNEVVELKAKEIAKDVSENVTEEVKEELADEYEKKFEEYKNDITSKFSNFVDEVLEQELQIPEKVYEYARKGEMYEPLIEQFKVKLGIDEGALQDEVKDLLKEAKSEIVNLKDQLNETKKEKMELEEDAKELSTHVYLRKKCDGLPEKQKSRIMNLLEDAKSKEEIDRKFDILSESVKRDGYLTEETYYCKDCGAEVELEENESPEDKTCPECEGELTSSKEGNSKGKDSVEESKQEKEKKKKVDESKSSRKTLREE